MIVQLFNCALYCSSPGTVARSPSSHRLQENRRVGSAEKSLTSPASKFPTIDDMDFYDFPLVGEMRKAFGFGGNLGALKSVTQNGHALPGPKAITFVRNHDIDRGQAKDGGLGGDVPAKFDVGWDDTEEKLNRTDVKLAYAFTFGREDGLPYVFVDMPTAAKFSGMTSLMMKTSPRESDSITSVSLRQQVRSGPISGEWRPVGHRRH